MAPQPPHHVRQRATSARLWVWLVLGAGCGTSCASALLPLPRGQWAAERISFSGLSWRARSEGLRAGAGNNLWSPRPPNVEVDDTGALHLRALRLPGGWRGAELSTPLPDSPCRIVVKISRGVVNPDPRMVFGVFVYRSDESEFDFEVGRWSPGERPAGLFTVVPATAAGHQQAVPAIDVGPAELVIEWRDDRVRFSLTTPVRTVTWAYSGTDVPRLGGHRLHMNLWPRFPAEPGAAASEVVITSVSIRRTMKHRPRRDP